MCTTHGTDCTACSAFALQANRRPSGLWPAAAAGAGTAAWEEASFRKYFPDSTRFGFPQIGHVLRNSGTMTVMAAMGRAARALRLSLRNLLDGRISVQCNYRAFLLQPFRGFQEAAACRKDVRHAGSRQRCRAA